MVHWGWWVALGVAVVGVACVLIFYVYWDSIRGTTSDAGTGAPGTPDSTGTVPSTLARVSIQTLPSINRAHAPNPTAALATAVGADGVATLTGVSTGVSGTLVDAAAAAGEPVKNGAVNALMELECYWRNPDGSFDSACPPAIQAALDAAVAQGGTVLVDGASTTLHVYPAAAADLVDGRDYPYWWSNFSFAGMLHHAQAYMTAPYALTGATEIDAYTLVATHHWDGTALASATATAPHKYYFAFPAGFYNRYQADSNVLYLWHAGSPRRFGCLPSLKVLHTGATAAETRNTGGAQLYATTTAADTGAVRVVAMNQVMAYTQATQTANEGFRDVLLLNATTRRFLFKSGARGAHRRVLVGEGGYDYANETWQAGRYYARVFAWDADTVTWQALVDGQTNTVVTADAAPDTIAAGTDPFAAWVGAPTAAAATTYLGLTAVEAADLATVLALFADGGPLDRDAVPGPDTDAANFPDSVTVTAAAAP